MCCANASAAVGGKANCICCGDMNVTGGGISNFISSQGGFSSAIGNVIAGGYNNRIRCDSCFSLSGGFANTIDSGAYTVALGGNSSASNYANAVALGSYRTISSNKSVFGEELVKSAGMFSICHPDPEKYATSLLRHSFVESPTAGDNVYRYRVTTVEGTAELVLPGYFKFLNKDVQVHLQSVGHLGTAYGTLSQDLNKINFTSTADGEYDVFVFGTRKDPDALKFWKGAERMIENED